MVYFICGWNSPAFGIQAVFDALSRPQRGFRVVPNHVVMPVHDLGDNPAFEALSAQVDGDFNPLPHYVRALIAESHVRNRETVHPAKITHIGLRQRFVYPVHGVADYGGLIAL